MSQLKYARCKSIDTQNIVEFTLEKGNSVEDNKSPVCTVREALIFQFVYLGCSGSCPTDSVRQLRTKMNVQLDFGMYRKWAKNQLQMSEQTLGKL